MWENENKWWYASYPWHGYDKMHHTNEFTNNLTNDGSFDGIIIMRGGWISIMTNINHLKHFQHIDKNNHIDCKRYTEHMKYLFY